MSRTTPTIALLPGDGIGPEVVQAARDVLDAVGFDAEYVEACVGWQAWCENGDPLPTQTWETARDADAVLFGAITSKPADAAEKELAPHLRGTGLRYQSPILRLRQGLGLHTNIRPVTFWPNVPTPLARPPSPHGDGTPFTLTILRENTEDLYLGCEAGPGGEDMARLARVWPDTPHLAAAGAAATLRVITPEATKRLARVAFARARADGHHKVVLAEKANVLRSTGAVVLRAFEAVAAEHPDVTLEVVNVDALATRLIREPVRSPLVAATNLFGDILSDLAAGLAGGLGVAPSGNIGDRTALFEPVHGSAPDIAGLGRANPTATILAAAMMLEHLGENTLAHHVRTGVGAALARPERRTIDLGGSADTATATRAIIEGALASMSALTASV